MKHKRVQRPVGFCACFAAFISVIYFVALALRRRSVVSAWLAVITAIGTLGVTCALFSELVAPDSDGVRAAEHKAEDTSELFEDEELAVALQRIDAELGIN